MSVSYRALNPVHSASPPVTPNTPRPRAHSVPFVAGAAAAGAGAGDGTRPDSASASATPSPPTRKHSLQLDGVDLSPHIPQRAATMVWDSDTTSTITDAIRAHSAAVVAAIGLVSDKLGLITTAMYGIGKVGDKKHAVCCYAVACADFGC